VRLSPLVVRVAALFSLLACTRGEAHEAPSRSTLASPPRVDRALAGDTVLMRRADHARTMGRAAAPLWVVEVSDFQCPFCRRWHDDSYQAIKHEYVDTGKIRLAYVNFPLPTHKNAWPAAEAAMCAAAYDHFWPMHDALFTTQDRWESSANPQPFFDSLAVAAGVPAADFKQCVAQHAVRPLIEADVDRATDAGVESTPTFLIGGATIHGAQPTATFRQTIDAALARAGSTAKP